MTLDAELVADGWREIGDANWIMWTHCPSKRVVTCDGPTRWGSCRGIPAHGATPASVSLARRIRAEILAEKPTDTGAEQLTLGGAK